MLSVWYLQEIIFSSLKQRLYSSWLWHVVFDTTWLFHLYFITGLNRYNPPCAVKLHPHSLHTSMLKPAFILQCWFRQGSVAIYWGIVSDSGLVKSYFVLWVWSSALPPGLRRWRTKAGMLTGDPKSSPIFHPYCPWHIQSGRVPSTEREKVRSMQLRWSERSVSLHPPSVVLSRAPIFFAKTMQFSGVHQGRRG